jgi:hypothetical protein
VRRSALVLAALAFTLCAVTAGCGDDQPSPPATVGTFGARSPAYLGGLIPVIDVTADAEAAQPFIVDTGSPVTLLNSVSYGHAQDFSAHETHDLGALGLTFETISTVVLGAFPPDACGTPDTAGIIGGDLLHFYQLTVDYLGSALFLWNGISASPDIGQDVAPAVAVPIRVKGGGRALVGSITVDLPPTRIIVDGQLESYSRTFLVDTGASLVTISNDTFSTLDHTDRPRIADIPIQTIYGVQNGFITRLAKVSVGDVTLESVPAVVVPDPTLFTQIGAEVGETISLFIGGTFLRNYQTTVRYSAERLDLARYNNPVHVNPAEFVGPGFDLASGCNGGLFVARVYPASSAAAQNVNVGAQLLTIDTQSVAGMTIDEANRLLHSYQPGDSVTFELQNFTVRTVTLTYADLLPPYTG